MAKRKELIEFLDNELKTEHFNSVEEADFNGAWTEGAEEVEKIGVCTNTTFENIEAAERNNCDLVIVHHGGWKRFDMDLLEQKKQKIEESNITWYIAHQILDCAEDYGICGALAEKIGIEVDGKYCDIQGGHHGRYGQLKVSKQEFLDRLNEIEPDHKVIGEIGDIEDQKIGIVGGGGGCFGEIVKETIDIGCEVFITGNSMFATDIYAYEKGLTMITLEETSSEKWGVYALGEKLEEEFQNLQTHRIKEKNW